MEELLKQTFGADLWNITNELSNVSSTAYNDIRNAALLIGFLIVIFQLFIIMWQSHKDDMHAASRIPQRLIALFLQVGLISAMLLTGTYTFLYKMIIGVPAELIATNITVLYIDTLQTQWSLLYKDAGLSAAGVWSFITATFSESLLSTLIASFVYSAAAIVTYLVPIVLGKLYLYLYYIGPIALVFTFCDYTQSVAKSWLNLSLSIAWAGVFGSIALLISINGGVLSGLQDGVTQKDWITTCVYGIVSIALMIMSFPISQYFFGAMGSGLSNMANPVSMIGRGTSFGSQAAIAGGATAAIAGNVLSGIGSTLGGGSGGGGNKTGAGSFISQSGGEKGTSATIGPQRSNVPGGSLSGSPNVSDAGDNSTIAQNRQETSSIGQAPVSEQSGALAAPQNSNVPGASQIGTSSSPKTKLQAVGDMMNKLGHTILTAGSVSSSNAPLTQRTVNQIEKQIGDTLKKDTRPGEDKNTTNNALNTEVKSSEKA